VPEQIPFIADRGRINVGELYVPAPDHKALAISYSRIGMITGQADVETAKNGALDNCRKALESAGIHNKCELYAVGNTVVYQGGRPPMPPRPWFRSDPSIERPVNSKDVPFVNADDRSRIEKNYLAARKSKALALSPRGGVHYALGALSQDESARRALEICGHMAGIACMIIAIDDVFVVPIPTMMNAVGFFQSAGNALIAPGSRDNVARRLATGTRGWSAVATGANGLAGVVPDAGSEQSAIEGALADCTARDHGCHVIAIGPFSVVAGAVGKTP
jgi:adenylate cyclase